jgi:hypothetical protein
MRNVYQILVRKPGGKSQHGDLIVGQKRALKWCLKIDNYVDDVDWTNLAQSRGEWLALVNTVMSLRVVP